MIAVCNATSQRKRKRPVLNAELWMDQTFSQSLVIHLFHTLQLSAAMLFLFIETGITATTTVFMEQFLNHYWLNFSYFYLD